MNPYEVLGIKQNATETEIKKAYRDMVKKYHPDRYQDNPLSDLAEEKLREINQAYEMLTNGVAGQTYGSNNTKYNGSFNQGSNNGGPGYSDGFAGNAKPGSAEWFYQAGVTSINKGWYDDGMGKLQTAVSMEPKNVKYREALNQVSSMGGGYKNNAYGRGYGNQNDDLCKMMQCLVCTDCLCDCI